MEIWQFLSLIIFSTTVINSFVHLFIQDQKKEPDICNSCTQLDNIERERRMNVS